MGEKEVLDVVCVSAEARGHKLSDFHLTAWFCAAGTVDAALSPWPGEDCWCVLFVHDLIHRGFIQCSGASAYVNPRTGEVRWFRGH
jgi:hypothetical protein